MEYWDLTDQYGNCLGQTIEKGAPHPVGTYHLVIGVWTVTKDGRALLTRRSERENQYPGKWENTGGCARSGENGIACALRELQEEVGITARAQDLRLLGTRLEKTAFIQIYGMLIPDDSMELRLQQSEVSAAGWFTRDQWEEMILKGIASDAALGRMRTVEQSLEEMGFRRR